MLLNRLKWELGKDSDKVGQLLHDLSVSLVDVNAYLGDQIIGESKLGERKSGNRELADAHNSDPKLGDCEESACELAYGYYSPGRNGTPVRSIFEGNMQERKPEHYEFGLVFKAPTIPFVFSRTGSAAVRAGKGLFRYNLPAFPACFHFDGLLLPAFITINMCDTARQVLVAFRKFCYIKEIGVS